MGTAQASQYRHAVAWPSATKRACSFCERAAAWPPEARSSAQYSAERSEADRSQQGLLLEVLAAIVCPWHIRVVAGAALMLDCSASARPCQSQSPCGQGSQQRRSSRDRQGSSGGMGSCRQALAKLL